MSPSVLVIRTDLTGCGGAGDTSESRDVCRWSEAQMFLEAWRGARLQLRPAAASDRPPLASC